VEISDILVPLDLIAEIRRSLNRKYVFDQFNWIAGFAVSNRSKQTIVRIDANPVSSHYLIDDDGRVRM